MSATDELDEWKWMSRPSNDVEFDLMMSSLDRHLSAKQLQPHQRGLHAAMQVSRVLRLSGTPLLTSNPERGAPFGPRDLLARVHEWYDANYGDQMKIDWSPGSILLVINNNVWKLKIPRVWGTMKPFADRNLSNSKGISIGVRKPPKHNVLGSIDGLTQAFATKMTDQELAFVLEAFNLGFQAMSALEALTGSPLFDEARADYRHSVDAVLSGHEFGKARWETAQCCEKIIKGLLARGGYTFPTSAGKGHDLQYLAKLVHENLGLEFDAETLATIRCSAAVRYGEIECRLDEVIGAHSALVHFLAVLNYHAKKGRL